MAWSDPRTWEGWAQHGDDADRIGEAPATNRYSFNTLIRDLLLETMPAKLTAAGDIAVATGTNALKRLAIGTNDYALRVNAAGDDLEYVNVDDAEGDLYPTTARYDLVQGNAANAPARLPVAATGTKLLTAHGSEALLTWEDV